MVEQHFCLRWNNYRTNITAEFETLREGEHFVDVTLACDGQQLKAHKVVLSACSPYFKVLLKGNPCSHPIIILRDVAYTHMRSLLEFMYAGEVNISQAQLGAFLHTAEALKIRGLAESSDDRKDQSGVNSVSPLAALKSSLGGLSSMSLGGLGPSILERPLVPQLLGHHCDKQQAGLSQGGSHLLVPHLLPPGPPQSLASGTTLPTSSSSSSPGLAGAAPPSSSNVTLSSSGSAVPGPLGPLSLTVAHSSQPTERPPRPDTPPHRDPSPTHHTIKRIRTEPRVNTYDSTQQPKPNHTDSTNGTTPCTLSTLTKTSTLPEDGLEAVPKVEPVEISVSEGEGLGGEWCLGGEEGDSSSGPGLHVSGFCSAALQQHQQQDGQPGTPGQTPPGGTPPHPNNTSHLLQALKSESHLQGKYSKQLLLPHCHLHGPLLLTGTSSS
ncbi:unnamed protein product [Meganyctiphanes norvegica]|uniref:BTB domain-containing protein n=1 Tax=Meganyctiphanes norvegica TaxID=48144 RepID=A0AAV2PLT1_MEGNR